MRRSLTILLAVATTVVLLTACAATGDGDGDLADDWPALPVAAAFTPAAGVCQAGDFTDVVTLSAYQPVDCRQPHRVETVHVGAFPVEWPAPPAGGSAQLRGAFADCDARAVGYLGDDWRAARLRLSVALPSGPGWAAGSRWYRCDVSEVTTVEAAATVVTRTGSLRDVLKGASSLRLGCQQTRSGAGGGVQTLLPVECATRHDAEFVGVWRAPDGPYPTRDADWVPLYDGCRAVLGRYVGVPVDTDLHYRSGVVVRPPAAGRWRVGDRGVRCYLWLSDRAVSASLKGAGPAGLPVRTR
ncbi:septum formation family protein [Micromonospora sp. WMMD812]|uniref:septum formation family protein n=1 Tax=Micromonospora sp. WMMD812 TaxID=3015152 RepID=UPI00248C1B5C|nr:septum formation family protein [Micromonospora sp. WMMD812]WBB66057.1 septum formation family protein [Micromonospora sp. WMMD812]